MTRLGVGDENTINNQSSSNVNSIVVEEINLKFGKVRKSSRYNKVRKSSRSVVVVEFIQLCGRKTK